MKLLLELVLTINHWSPPAAAIINGDGAIESVVITGGGSGYRNGSVDIQVFNPLGIGSTAVLSATVGTAGTVTGITTVSGGSGYASTNPPTIVVGVPTGYTNICHIQVELDLTSRHLWLLVLVEVSLTLR